jgi:hypothetical protein
MKRILFLLALLLPVPALAVEIGASEAMGVRVMKFQREGDNVVVQLAMDINGWRVGTKNRWELTPVIEQGLRMEELPPIVVSGHRRAAMLRRAQKAGRSTSLYGASDAMADEILRRDESRSVVYNITVAWQPWMQDAVLNLRARLVTCNGVYGPGKERLGVLSPIAEAAPKGAPRPSYVAPMRDSTKGRAIVRTAYIDFRVDESAVVPSLGRNESELAAIRHSLDEVRSHPDFTFRGIRLTGYASPEGPYPHNDHLASARVHAVSSYVASHFGVNPHNISLHHVAEDWAGLRQRVEKSSLPDKVAALNIIDSPQRADDKETVLKMLSEGAPWSEMLGAMMPPLRRTEYLIDYAVRSYNIAESRELLRTNPELLSHYELDALARTYAPGSQEFEEIYNLIEVQNPADDTANIAAAANYIRRGHRDGAAAALARVKNRDAAYWNNYGIVQMMSGNPAAAADAFRKSGTADAQHNARLLE